MERLQICTEAAQPPERPPTHPGCPGPSLRPGRRPSPAGARDPGHGFRELPRQTRRRAPAPQPSGARGQPGARSPGTSALPPEVAGGRAGFGNMQGHGGRRPLTQALRNLTSQPRHTGGHGAARSGAGLPAPARTVKLQRPEVPPPSGVTWPGTAPGGGSGLPGKALAGTVIPVSGRELGAWEPPPHPAAALGPLAATPLHAFVRCRRVCQALC